MFPIAIHWHGTFQGNQRRLSMICRCPDISTELSPTIWTSVQTSKWGHRKMSSFAIVFTLLSYLLLRQLQLAAATTVTIDDEYGDSLTGALPVYGGPWQFGPSCSGCLLHPSPADTFRSGWHDTTTSAQYAQQSVTLTFKGTSYSYSSSNADSGIPFQGQRSQCTVLCRTRYLTPIPSST